MPKNLVFCADGTWNGPGRDLDDRPVPVPPSNVLKLYHWLAGQDTLASTQVAGEAERIEVDASTGAPLQVAKYLDGVGYDQNWLVKFLGGAFGAGIVTRIVRGYTFLSRNYQPGDLISLVGFSRGAYTARALAGLILSQGLLDARKLDLSDKESAYRLGCAVWASHQRQLRCDWLAQLESTLYDLPGFFTRPPDPTSLLAAPLQAVGVWDTVGAMGIPRFDGEDRRLDTFRFADQVLDPRARYGFQALALDEERADFTPSLWNPRSEVIQTLFPGAHADVGGSYPSGNGESGLSDGALVWMQQQLASLPPGGQVHFGVRPSGVQPDPTGPAHQPWTFTPYVQLGHGPRDFQGVGSLLVDPSVRARMTAASVQPDPSRPAAPYRPCNLPTC